MAFTALHVEQLWIPEQPVTSLATYRSEAGTVFLDMTNTGLAYTINRDGGTFQSQKRSWPWQWYELPACPDLANALRWYELCRAQWYELCREINTPEFWLDDVR